MNSGLDICPISPLTFVECPSDQYEITGNILVAQTYDFSPSITEPYWALAFSSLGNAYPHQVNVQQALFFTNLQVYPSDLPTVNSTTAQFSDSYETPTGLIQTQWQIAFDHTAKTITVQNLLTKMPQGGGFRACSEVLLNFWKMTAFQYQQAPAEIIFPY